MDILFSRLLLLIVFLPMLSQSDRLLKSLVIFLCFMKTESHEFSLSRDYIKEQIFPFDVSSTPYPIIIFLYFDSASHENIVNFSVREPGLGTMA